jgi:hypothetical protein
MGKSGLGKLLDESPIRMMSPVGLGGTGNFAFDLIEAGDTLRKTH